MRWIAQYKIQENIHQDWKNEKKQKKNVYLKTVQLL